MRRTLIISLFLASLLMVTLAVNQSFGLSASRRNIQIKVVGISVYSDKSCRNVLTSIDWGIIRPGSSKSIMVYVKNTGNVIVRLSLSTENWIPEQASKYISLTWNYMGQRLLPGRVLSLTLTLTVSPEISDIRNFSFDIVITGLAIS
ncbi:MAG: hypothetical protein QXF23_01000 [Candidatus Bathyarchaeia archaeon]|nr:hypothetical protein [Candidatus Bathyarchaeota archaeon]